MLSRNFNKTLAALIAREVMLQELLAKMDSEVWQSGVQESIEALFPGFRSFIPGLRLIDGSDLLQFANFFFSNTQGITALAGGGNTGPVLTTANNVITVCATNNDSVVLPPSGNLPVGVVETVTNHGAATLAVFGNPNPGVDSQGNALSADQIVASASTAGAASVTQATQKIANYELITAGTKSVGALWKQFLSG